MSMFNNLVLLHIDRWFSNSIRDPQNMAIKIISLLKGLLIMRQYCDSTPIPHQRRYLASVPPCGVASISGLENLLLLQTWVQFLALTWWLTTTCNSNSRASDHQGHQACTWSTCIHAGKMRIYSNSLVFYKDTSGFVKEVLQSSFHYSFLEWFWKNGDSLYLFCRIWLWKSDSEHFLCNRFWLLLIILSSFSWFKFYKLYVFRNLSIPSKFSSSGYIIIYNIFLALLYFVSNVLFSFLFLYT